MSLSSCRDTIQAELLKIQLKEAALGVRVEEYDPKEI